jgi:hypothetical protein
MGNSAAKKVNWDIARQCLAYLHREAPSILQQAVVIGGVACWFYRNLLEKAHDDDFKLPRLSEVEETLWLSKDLDFTNYFAEDARQLLKRHVKTDQGRQLLEIAGVPIGFAQVGLTFDPESAWSDSWIATFDFNGTTVQCRILDPVSLYWEKTSLSERRGSASDRSHLSVVAEFLRLETCLQAESLSKESTLEERTCALNFLIRIRNRVSEISRDSQVAKRLTRVLNEAQNLSPIERKLLGELITLK